MWASHIKNSRLIDRKKSGTPCENPVHIVGKNSTHFSIVSKYKVQQSFAACRVTGLIRQVHAYERFFLIQATPSVVSSYIDRLLELRSRFPTKTGFCAQYEHLSSVVANYDVTSFILLERCSHN